MVICGAYFLINEVVRKIDFLTICMLGIFAIVVFCLRCLFFKINFFKSISLD